jgi:hypothetical protein
MYIVYFFVFSNYYCKYVMSQTTIDLSSNKPLLIYISNKFEFEFVK